jgi:hypothetical protein
LEKSVFQPLVLNITPSRGLPPDAATGGAGGLPPPGDDDACCEATDPTNHKAPTAKATSATSPSLTTDISFRRHGRNSSLAESVAHLPTSTETPEDRPIFPDCGGVCK